MTRGEQGTKARARCQASGGLSQQRAARMCSTGEYRIIRRNMVTARDYLYRQIEEEQARRARVAQARRAHREAAVLAAQYEEDARRAAVDDQENEELVYGRYGEILLDFTPEELAAEAALPISDGLSTAADGGNMVTHEMATEAAAASIVAQQIFASEW
jgi:hypothetical protein